MKIQSKSKESGTVMVVTIFTIMVISIVLASYLTLVTTESKAVSRSQTWNACVPVMEAGVEEALAHIHACGSTTNLSGNNWTFDANGNYIKTRTVGTDGSYCDVTIVPVMPPIIYSTAYVPVAMGDASFISRKVRVTTTTQYGYGGGLIAAGSIDLRGNSMMDSYNPTNGPYNPANHGTNAIALSMGTGAGVIQVGGGTVYGMVITGPGGTASASGSGVVGDVNWVATHTGIEPGWSANDGNVQINDNQVPNTAGWITSIFPGQIGGVGTNYDYLINGANYVVNGALSLSSKTMGVTGNSTLYITGDFSLSSTAYIYVAPGASLTIYLGGNGSFSGQGILNANMTSGNVKLLGLPTCTSLNYSGSDQFYGVLNAPEADIKFTGGSDSFGSITGKTITMGGNGRFHYDESLAPPVYIVMASWNEL